MNDRKDAHKVHFSLSKKILFAAIIVITLFGLLELGLRIGGFTFKPQYSIVSEKRWSLHGVQQDPDLPWSWVPSPGALCHIDGASDFHFNTLGYRGPVVGNQKDPHAVRLVCLGDSGTMGWGVRDGDPYCERVKEILERRCDKHIETINAGVFGYTSYQGLHLMKEKILNLHPDFVSFCFNWNDHSSAIRIAQQGITNIWDQGLPTPDRLLYTPGAFSGARSFISELRIFQLTEFAMLKARKDSAREETPEEAPDSESAVLRVPIEDYKTNLKEMIELSAKNHITPILLTQSINPKHNEEPARQLQISRQQLYNDAVREVARERNVVFVDPTNVLEKDAKFFSSNTHPTRTGHRIIAQLLSDAICPLIP